jgi:hypothetical protein
MVDSRREVHLWGVKRVVSGEVNGQKEHSARIGRVILKGERSGSAL